MLTTITSFQVFHGEPWRAVLRNAAFLVNTPRENDVSTGDPVSGASVLRIATFMDQFLNKLIIRIEMALCRIGADFDQPGKTWSM